MLEEKSKEYTNALIKESSPYLLQHAHNPVHWYPWGKEALQKAEKENKPLIISIGYAACHWCHVMEHESYSDEEVAAYMNEHFISVKVDREERTDIDQIYMDASMVLNGSGGWPLNAFALPDGRPFFVLTYLPRKDWLNLLRQIVEVYQNQYEEAVGQAEAITQGIRSQNLIRMPKDSTREEKKAQYLSYFGKTQKTIDYEWGGFNRAPKFALPVAWEWMLQNYYLTGNGKSLEAVRTTLTRMAWGGIYDQIGGGFARYATDTFWVVPHFEKMLYDNGQLVSLYAQAYRATPDPLFEQVIRETLGFVLRELMDTSGGFYSSLNADSEGEEGKFYVWKEEELLASLPAGYAKLLLEYYRISTSGNWEDEKNILFHTVSDAAFAQKHKLSLGEWKDIRQKSNGLLLQERNKRTRPTTDDKILTGWNGLMLRGFVEAYKALGEESYLKTALAVSSFLERNMMKADGSLWRNYKDQKVSIEGLLDDYAFLIEGWIGLYQVTFDLHWLDLANTLTGYVLEHFSDDKTSLFFYTSDKAESLIARKREVEDGVMPSSNATMSWNLYHLGIYRDSKGDIKRAISMLSSVADQIPAAVPYFSKWAQLAGLVQKGPYEVAIAGNSSLQKALEMQKMYLPTSIFLGGNTENLPLLQDKLKEGKTMIYVCENKVCQKPVEKVEVALRMITGG